VRSTAEDVAVMLAYADRVIIIPGWPCGRAGSACSRLADELREARRRRQYAIHPVAGRTRP
jgi:NAD(P) transhydrogenase subunit beta